MMTEDQFRYLWQCTKLHQIAPVYADVADFSVDYYVKVLQSSSVIFRNGAFFMDDFDNGLVTITNGTRLTVGNPDSFDNAIHMIGPSNVLATYCENAHTIPSFLRKLCKHDRKLRDYGVINYGTTAGDLNNYVLQIKSVALKENDIVILLGSDWFYDSQKHELGTWRQIVHLDAYCKEKKVKFAFFRRPEIRDLCHPSHRERLLMEHSYKELATDTLKKAYPPLNKKYHAPSYLDKAIGMGCACYDLALAVERPHNYKEIFADRTHLGPQGNNLVAHAMYDNFLKHVFDTPYDADAVEKRASKLINRLFSEKAADSNEILAWIRSVKESSTFHINDGDSTIGCIVMNANPFTNGHRHLVEKALEVVRFLYVFVVEEDASEFSFAERLALVKLGTRTWGERVNVFPSGKFIISSFTFPEYFAKSRKFNVQADTSAELALFSTTIAPQLGISHRFVGEEPTCNITRQYNAMMRQLLPGMGIDVVEIPRITEKVGGRPTPISASTVRELIQKGAVAETRALVPDTTFGFLQSKFSTE